VQSVAWRVVHPSQSFSRLRTSLARQPLAGRFHRAGDGVIYAWASSEAAYMSLSDLVGRHQPLNTVRETLRLPDLDIPHLESLWRRPEAAALRQDRSQLVTVMRHLDILAVVCDSDLCGKRSLYVINLLHPLFAGIELLESRAWTAARA